MDKQMGIIIVLVLITACAINANKSYKKTYNKCVSEQKCRDSVSNRKCCHIGNKLAKQNYECSVDGVISTQDYLRTLKHKIHSLSSIPVNPIFKKVKKCKSSEDCMRCCCILRKRHMLTSRYRMRRLNVNG